jgi:hypothetical protein
MAPNRRLWLIVLLVVLSAGYAVITKQNVSLGYALAVVYIAILIKVLLYLHICGRRAANG